MNDDIDTNHEYFDLLAEAAWDNQRAEREMREYDAFIGPRFIDETLPF